MGISQTTSRVEVCLCNPMLLVAGLETRCTYDYLTRLGVKVSLLDLHTKQ